MQSIGDKAFISSLWVMASKWVLRFLGIISTIILARILTKEDFGIVAIATMVVAILEIVMSNGSANYLIRKQKIIPEDYNTAWTIRILLLSTMGLILLLSAHSLTLFFDDPRLLNVFYLLALTMFLSGFQNTGLVILKKNFNFKSIFWFESLKKIIGFITTIGLAFYLENYWAIIWGLFALRISAVMLSFYFSSYRPRLTLCHWEQQYHFSKWVVLSNLTNLIREKAEQIIISKMLGVNSIGLYSMALHIASMPMTELVQPLMEILYSAYSKVLNKREQLSIVFIKSVGIISIITLPVLAGLWLLSEPMVHLLLGHNWDEVIPLLKIIIIMISAQIYITIASNLLTVLGKVKFLAIVNWLLIIVLIPVLIFVAQKNDLELLLMVRALLAFMFLPFFFFALFKYLELNIIQLSFSFLRPFISTIIMIIGISLINRYIMIESELLIVIIDALTGSIIYSFSVIALWLVTGRSIGGESYILDKVERLLARFSMTRKLSAAIHDKIT